MLIEWLELGLDRGIGGGGGGIFSWLEVRL